MLDSVSNLPILHGTLLELRAWPIDVTGALNRQVRASERNWLRPISYSMENPSVLHVSETEAGNLISSLEISRCFYRDILPRF